MALYFKQGSIFNEGFWATVIVFGALIYAVLSGKTEDEVATIIDGCTEYLMKRFPR